MNVKEIDNQNTTRDNAYKIHINKYIEHNSNKTITTSMREKRTDKYEYTRDRGEKANLLLQEHSLD